MADSKSLCQLPIINLKKDNLKPGASSWLEICEDVRHALEEYGCFWALQDQVSEQLEMEVYDVITDLFDLPKETKALNRNNFFSGYVGQLPHAPIHESTGISNVITIEGVQTFTDLMWPSGNKRFWYE